MSASLGLGTKVSRAASEVNIDATSILLRRILKTKLATDFLNARFNFLNVMRRVVSFADDRTQCKQPPSLAKDQNPSDIGDPLLTHANGFVHETWRT